MKAYELQDYEVYYDLQQQMIRSQFQSTNVWLKAIFRKVKGVTNDLESSDSEDEEKEQVTLTKEELVGYILNHFDLADYVRGGHHLTKTKTARRVAHMVDTFVVQGQNLNPEKLTHKGLLAAFSVRIDLKLPVSAFFQIGINACVEFEN